MTTITFPTTKTRNGYRYSRREKETISGFKVVAFDNDRVEYPICAWCYMGRSRDASVVHATMAVSNTDHFVTGRGKASGYGYDKEGAALERALNSCGVSGDAVDQAAREFDCGQHVTAFQILAKALGHEKFEVVTF